MYIYMNDMCNQPDTKPWVCLKMDNTILMGEMMNQWIEGYSMFKPTGWSVCHEI